MNPKYEKLKNLLKELFQLDRPDLDFGLYRVMHAKSGEVTQFLDKDLLPQVQAELAKHQTADKAELTTALAKAIEQAHALGADPDSLPKVQELRAQLQHEAVDRSGLESEVYDHLYSFFRRYYSEGDFLAKRVYKAGVYAIPYEGEEVTLHWANKDQYYIKTSEYLRDYAFRLRPNDPSTTPGQAQIPTGPGHANHPMRVHFRLVEAAEGEHDNVKASEGKDRAFILAREDFITEEDGEQGRELSIRFEYRPATLSDWPEDLRAGKSKPPTQKDLTLHAVKRLLDNTVPELAEWIGELAQPHTLASGERAEYTRLEAHLRRYAARNTFDYFIHKELGPFLRRELDFFIKNEVMHLDDVENETAPRVEQYLSKIKAIRRIGGKIIDFLAQLENFQKKLWLKKKFVVETQWCIRVGCIPEDFYPEIASNTAQHEEWMALLAIDEIAGDAITPGYSVPLATDFLVANPSLVVDTRHFDAAFTARLLEAMGDVDAQTDGVLFHSENFQALSLMQVRYQERVNCIYIDPPYNAKSSEILYKNDYKHSTWLTLIDDRVAASRPTMKQNSTFVTAIDEVEQECLGQLLSMHFPDLTKDCIVVNHNPSGQQGDNFSYTHEYAYFLHPSPGRFIAEQIREDQTEWDERNFRDVTGDESLRTAGKNCFYPIFVRGEKVVGFGDVCTADYHPAINERVDDETIAVYPVDPNGIERKWRFARNTVDSIKDELIAHLIRGRGIIDIKRIKKNLTINPTGSTPVTLQTTMELNF